MLSAVYRVTLGKLFWYEGIWVIKFWTHVELHDIKSSFLVFILPFSVRHWFTVAGLSDFPQSFWRASGTAAAQGFPTPDQLNQNPGVWTQAELFYKSFVDSNEIPGYKNHWVRIAKLGEDA